MLGLLKTTLHYDPETGHFTYLKNGRKWKAGQRAGGVGNHGYRNISFNGKRWLEHRLAWVYMTGAEPTELIDHADRDKTNNKWCNLREASRCDNRHNSRAKGFFASRKRFAARAVIDGKQQYLGNFLSEEAAHAAFKEATIAAHGEQFQYSM